jgi:preprotein translocase subunit Sec63
MGKYKGIIKARQVPGLDESASLRDVKDKYRELLKEWHPDLAAGSTYTIAVTLQNF